MGKVDVTVELTKVALALFDLHQVGLSGVELDWVVLGWEELKLYQERFWLG